MATLSVQSRKGSAVAPRGSAAAIAGMRRRQHGGGEGCSRPRASDNVLSFYTDNRGGFRLSVQGTLVMCTGFIAFVMGLHILGLFFRVQ